MSIGSRLRAERRRKGLTQIEAAKALAVENVTLSRYESDSRNPDYEFLSKAGKYYGCSMAYLLGETQERARGERPVVPDVIQTVIIDGNVDDFTDEDWLEIAEHIEFQIWQVKKRKDSNKKK